jgi:hypothetical protein
MESQNIQAAELTQAMHQFREWFEREKSNGLVDVKFFLGNTSSNSATIEKAVLEFNQSNRMIEAGVTEPHYSAIDC